MTVCIILAKGDSNRIPKKNMKDFCGRPLVGWTIEQALCSRLVDKVALSTDNAEIKEYAQTFPDLLLIDRPYRFTLTPANQAVIHALDAIKKVGIEPDMIVSPLATSPARLPEDIDGLIATYMTKEGCVNASACCEQLETIIFKPTHNGYMKNVLFAKHHEYYVDGGGMSCFSPDWYRSYTKELPITDEDLDKTVVSGEIRANPYYCDPAMYVLKEWQTVELDLPEHWAIAEAVMREYILKPLGEDCYKKYKEQANGTKS
ncbi:MAG: hypothetical protein PHQ35_11330 [Phycisphaerae bacterium]|nr:hypothetical protein [Phycisphaerae bacterium]